MSKNKVNSAILLANIWAFILLTTKLIVWVLFGSLAVLASAIDSLMDFFVSLFNLYILKKSSDDSNKDFNYGYWKLQWIWAVFEWVVVWSSGVILIYLAIQKIINWWVIIDIDISIYVMIFSIFVTGGLVYYMTDALKRVNNLTLRSDILHYKTDLYTNIWIIVSLIIIKLTDIELIDPIISMIIGVYIIISSREIIIEWLNMLLDKGIDKAFIERIVYIIEHTDSRINSFHLLKTRKSWDQIFIDFHLVFNPDIKLLDAHHIWNKVESSILKFIPNASIMIHLDPYDDSKEDIEGD